MIEIQKENYFFLLFLNVSAFNTFKSHVSRNFPSFLLIMIKKIVFSQNEPLIKEIWLKTKPLIPPKKLLK